MSHRLVLDIHMCEESTGSRTTINTYVHYSFLCFDLLFINILINTREKQ